MHIKREKCIVCHKKINIKVDTPIEKRKYYVEGAGQLCKKCYEKLYLSHEVKEYGY